MTDDGRKKQTQMAASKAIGIKGKVKTFSTVCKT